MEVEKEIKDLHTLLKHGLGVDGVQLTPQDRIKIHNRIQALRVSLQCDEDGCLNCGS